MTDKNGSDRKYAEDGVNIVEGDSFSAFAGELCRQTYGNSPYVEVRDFSIQDSSEGHFRGPRGFRLKGLPDGCYTDLAPDGAGTKPVLIDAAKNYLEAAYGWVAMTCGDITRWGGLPLVLVNNLDVRTLGNTGDTVNDACRMMMASLRFVCIEQGLVMFKGETAELGACVGPDNPNANVTYLWSGVAHGVYHPDTIITGKTVKAGMVVIALKENGFRNNGISSVRKALEMKFGRNYLTSSKAASSVLQAATPAVLYDRFLARMNGWFQPNFKPIIRAHLIAHLSGGAIRSKFADDILFRKGLSADLNDLWDPPKIMQYCADWRGISDEECYETWNGGQGALVVIEEQDVAHCIEMAATHGIQAKVAGRIESRPGTPRVTIESKFRGDTVVYEPS